jgi:hypothetical protein
MVRHNCTSCGGIILKSGINDPYLCRDCERLLNNEELGERYSYLDNY